MFFLLLGNFLRERLNQTIFRCIFLKIILLNFSVKKRKLYILGKINIIYTLKSLVFNHAIRCKL